MKPVEIIQDKKNPHLYRLLYDDGVVSEEMYNKSRAVDVLNHFEAYQQEQAKNDASTANRMPLVAPEKPADALKMKKGIRVADDKKNASVSS